jgi:uncharacterized membrane protein YoaK (UPF0700 family)
MNTKRVHLALVLLSFGAGAADAFAFLALNGTFTANMTGNLVLAALFTRPGFGVTLACALMAILVFAAGLYVGFRATVATTSAPNTHRRLALRLLLPSIVMHVTVLALWLTDGHDQDAPLLIKCVVIALSAGALALQTVAAKKLSDIDGITTTYVTGTLTTTMQALVERKGRGEGLRALSILALPAGAFACAAVFHVAPSVSPGLALIVTTIAACVAFTVPTTSER